MRTLIIEDNIYHADSLKECLFSRFQNIEIGVLGTEYDVRRNIVTLEQLHVDVIILDIILPWCQPMPDMPPVPKDDNSPYEAGLRCLSLFLENPNFRNVPIIVYSVLHKERIKDALKKIPPNVLFVEKSSSFDDMVIKIESGVLTNQPTRRKLSKKDALLDSSELKIGIKGFQIDLKKFFQKRQ